MQAVVIQPTLVWPVIIDIRFIRACFQQGMFTYLDILDYVFRNIRYSSKEQVAFNNFGIDKGNKLKQECVL